MPKLVIDCTVDGQRVGRYEFDCTSVDPPSKLAGGGITIHFDPSHDPNNHHRMEITTLPPQPSNIIGGPNPQKP